MKAPLVSVIMPAFNCASTILEAVMSVRIQTYGNWELLIQDDGSTDETAELLCQELERDQRIKYEVSQENRGASHARNLAIQRARGTYVCFLDADDYWLPHKLANQVRFMETNRCSISATFCFRQSSNAIYLSKGPSQLRRSDLYRHNAVPFLSVMYRKQEVGEIKFRDLKSRNDLMFLLDCLDRTGVLHFVCEPLCVYREVTGSLSSNRIRNLKDHYKCLEWARAPKALIPIFIVSAFLHSLAKRRLPSLYNRLVANY